MPDGSWLVLPDTVNPPKTITVDFIDRPWISDTLGQIYTYVGDKWLK